MLIKSFDKVHIINVKSCVHPSLKSTQHIHRINLTCCIFPMNLYSFYPHFLLLNLVKNIFVIVDEEMQ